MMRIRGIQQGRPPWQLLLRTFRVLATGEVLARLLALVAVLLMARRLDPDGFGLVSLGLVVVLWLALVVDWGSEILGVRNVAREPARFREIAEPVLGLRIALCLPACGLVAALAWIVPATPGDRAVLALFALMLPMLALNPRWMVLGIGSSKAVAAGTVAGQLLLALGVLALVTDMHDTTAVPLLYAASEFTAAAVVLGAVVRRFGPIRPRIDRAAWAGALRSGRHILVNNVARTAVYSFDVLLVALLLGREQVGFYSAAYKPVMFAVAALAIFYASFLASYSAATTSEAGQLFRRSVLMVAALAMPAAAVLSIGAGAAVELLYGEAYAPAAGVLAILIWTIPLLGVSGAYAGVLIAADRQDVLMRNNVIGAAVNVLLNLLVVPLAGIEGAAAVTVASECLVLVLHARAVVSLGLEQNPIQLVLAFTRAHLVPTNTPSGER